MNVAKVRRPEARLFWVGWAVWCAFIGWHYDLRPDQGMGPVVLGAIVVCLIIGRLGDA